MQTGPTIAGLLHTPAQAQAQPKSEQRAIEGRAADVQRIASTGMAALGSPIAVASITAARPQTEQAHTGELIAMLAELEANATRLADECRVSRDTAETRETAT